MTGSAAAGIMNSAEAATITAEVISATDATVITRTTGRTIAPGISMVTAIGISAAVRSAGSSAIGGAITTEPSIPADAPAPVPPSRKADRGRRPTGGFRAQARPAAALDREIRGVVSAGMTAIQGVALFVAAYLLLLGRNAWKQGELGQFLWALAMVAGLLGIIALGVVAWGWLFGP